MSLCLVLTKKMQLLGPHPNPNRSPAKGGAVWRGEWFLFQRIAHCVYCSFHCWTAGRKIPFLFYCDVWNLSNTVLDIFPVLCCQDRFPAALTGPQILFRCQPLAIFLIVAIVTGEHPELLSSYTAKDNILPFIAKRAVTCRWMTARQTGISFINLCCYWFLSW